MLHSMALISISINSTGQFHLPAQTKEPLQTHKLAQSPSTVTSTARASGPNNIMSTLVTLHTKFIIQGKNGLRFVLKKTWLFSTYFTVFPVNLADHVSKGKRTCFLCFLLQSLIFFSKHRDEWGGERGGSGVCCVTSEQGGDAEMRGSKTPQQGGKPRLTATGPRGARNLASSCLNYEACMRGCIFESRE